MMHRAAFFVVSAALVAFLGVDTARANLFVNGSFENTGTTGVTPTTVVNVAAGSQIPGWTTVAGDNPAGGTFGNYFAGTAHNNATFNFIPTPAQNGNYFVQLDSANGGAFNYTRGNSIYQALSLTANTKYQLTFYFRSETGNTTNVLTTMTAYVGLDSQGNVGVNAAGYTSVAAQTFTSPQTVDTGWNLATLSFTAPTTNTYRFTFLDGATSPTKTNGGIDSNASLDNFDLEVVPEFAHWAVFAGFGLLVAGGSRLRRAMSNNRVAIVVAG